MTWVILIASGMLEAVWATALSASKGFRKPLPTIIFLVSMVVSMIGLGYAMTDIPTGTAYAVWTGTGATLTVIWAMITGAEKASVVRLILIGALIGAVVGLKVVS